MSISFLDLFEKSIAILVDVLRGSNVYESAVEGGFSTVVHLPSRFGGPELHNDEPLLCDVVIAGRATSSYIPVVAEVPTLAPCDDVNGATTDETWLQAQVRRGVLGIRFDLDCLR